MSSLAFPNEFCNWCGNYFSRLPRANSLRKIINDGQKKPGLADRQRYPFYLGWPRSIELSATFLCFNRTASRCVRLRKELDCEKDHNLAVSVTLCFQDTTAKLCFRILSEVIDNCPSRYGQNR
jgi:hypothetical protein